MAGQSARGEGRPGKRGSFFCRGVWFSFAAAFVWLLLPAFAAAQSSSWVQTGVTGRLIYVPAPDGDRIQDFSMVGYGAGKSTVPSNLPVIATINATLPAGSDYTTVIQNTINSAISGNAVQSNGFRGIVQFGPGEFDVSGHITISGSG